MGPMSRKDGHMLDRLPTDQPRKDNTRQVLADPNNTARLPLPLSSTISIKMNMAMVTMTTGMGVMIRDMAGNTAI